MLSLDHQSPVPLRAQVEALLRELIRQPQYQNGTLLPDEVALAAQLGVSRGTVRSGISKLVFEGLLDRKAGVGTRVSNRNVESGIQEWHSFTREMASKGITVENFRVAYHQLEGSKDALQALQLDGSRMLWRLDRVRGWAGRPVLHTMSWFHPRLGLKGTEDTTLPLYEMIEKASGVRPHHAREDFLAVSADAQMARQLEVEKGAPLLLRRHTVFDAGNRPFECAEVRYVSSRFALTLDVRRKD
ncbi:MAG TPA: GntR family transcriptional regulator [Candidatus Acidoferrales bacterium]|jgi:GntR family transcriptional regulator|nr:GntR family transcriptional regulator [Candidatus Acidoferrales bacterium]